MCSSSCLIHICSKSVQIPSFLKAYCFLRHLNVLQNGTEVKQHCLTHMLPSLVFLRQQRSHQHRGTLLETPMTRTQIPSWIMLACFTLKQAESSRDVPQLCPSCISYSFSIYNCRPHTSLIEEELHVLVPSCTKDACEYIKALT